MEDLFPITTELESLDRSFGKCASNLERGVVSEKCVDERPARNGSTRWVMAQTVRHTAAVRYRCALPPFHLLMGVPGLARPGTFRHGIVSK
jgi:hypothetical protein